MQGFNHARLRYLHEVIQCGTIRAAAAKMGIAPSAISRQISLLEEELDMGVLERHRRGATPTEAGNMLMTYYRQYTAQHNTIVAEIKSLRGLRSGTVHIATGEGLAYDLIHGPMRTFKADYPDVAFSIHAMSASEIIHSITEDEAEIGLLLYHAQSNPHIVVRGVRRQPLEAVVPPEHPLCQQENVSLADLTSWPIALLHRSFGIRQVIGHAEYAAKTELNPVLTTNSINCLIEFTVARQGITILPRFCVRNQIRSKTLRTVPITDETLLNSEIQVVARAGRYLSPAASQFLAYCLRDLAAISNNDGDETEGSAPGELSS